MPMKGVLCMHGAAFNTSLHARACSHTHIHTNCLSFTPYLLPPSRSISVDPSSLSMRTLRTLRSAPLFVIAISLHTFLLAPYLVHAQPPCLIASIVHRSSPTPLRRSFPWPLRWPSSSALASQLTSSVPSQSSSPAPPCPSPSPLTLPFRRISSPLPLSAISSSPLRAPVSATAPIMHALSPATAPSSTSLTSIGTSSSSTTDSKPTSAYRNFTATIRRGNASEIGPLSSELITLHEPFGQYFAVMELGSPPSEIAVIIDTGSELTWVQCEPCLRCGSQIRDPIFDPSQSHSYLKLQCNSTWCHDTTGLTVGCRNAVALSPEENIHNTSSTKPTECFYNATYGDNSVSFGELSIDTLTVPSASGAPVAVSRFVFGCGHENSGVETDFNASGLMGLDRGSHSIISQLGVPRFSYCLPDRSHNIDAAGFIVFGNYDRISMLARGKQQEQQAVAVENASMPPPMQYIKLLLNNKSDFYAQSYYVNLTGIRVGGEQLDIPLSVFEIDRISGYGGTIIDTGTSLTSFIDSAYAVFQDAVRLQISGDARPIYIPELPSFDSCYTVGKGQEAWPQISLQFDGGTTELQLPEGNAWLQVGTEGNRNLYCLAFAAAGEGAGGRNVIGNFQQQNFLVEYDVAHAQIGFVHLHRCSSGGERERWASLCLLIISVGVFFFTTS